MVENRSKIDERGVERCMRQVMTAIPNVLGDDSKGYHNVEALCNSPIVQRISDRVKGCPRCDKEPPVGNVHPRVTNSAGVALTAKELAECGVTEDTSKNVVPIREQEKSILAVEAKMDAVKKEVVVIEVSLNNLESDVDIARLLIQQVIDGMDTLPVTNFKESKRLIRLQEKLEKLLEA